MADMNQVPPTPNTPPPPPTPPPGGSDEKLGIGWIILSFIIPLVGLVLYFTNRKEHPKKAQTACYAALAGFALGVILNFLARMA
jgi:hypothetical protein